MMNPDKPTNRPKPTNRLKPSKPTNRPNGHNGLNGHKFLIFRTPQLGLWQGWGNQVIPPHC
ncbi:hypothetical protein J7M23_03945 [Candidatus Sumerlaeota bacterium]|nr:hypothetical protein [Candidatus Sumerlaeota bacterium]